MNSYYDELDFVRESDKSLYPDFLFNPVFNDFGDDYYNKSFAENEMMSSIKKLRRRYNDYYDWIDAMDIYSDYMEHLVDMYGSMKVIKNGLKNDCIPEPVPGKPKLKMTRRNKQFMRAGIVPTMKLVDDPIPKDELLAIARQAIPNANGDSIDDDMLTRKIPKEKRKEFQEMFSKMEANNRKRNLYRATGNSSGTDFIVEYLNQAKRGVYDQHGNKNVADEDRSLSSIIKENERLESTRPELLEDELANSTMIVNGRLVYRKDQERLEIYKELYGAGIDIMGNLNRTMDKKSVKMIKSQIGATEPSSKKELKKIRKQAKKDQRRLERRRDQNNLLEKTLLGNKISLGRNGDTLSFRLSDIMNDD